MQSERLDPDSIGPGLSLATLDLPATVGERFSELYGTDDPPADGAEWVAQMRTTIADARGRQPTVEDLCTTPDGDHAFVPADEAGDSAATAAGGAEETYLCVLDPLAYSFLTGETGTVRSTTPVRGETVTFDIGADDLAVSHDEAVVSLGVSDHLDGVDVDSAPVETVYRQVCGYIQTFADRAEYEQWAAEADAVTMALSAEEGVAVARELARTLFTGDTESA
jgi:hypothetical protein